MARGVNKVILIGTLGADPETRSMPSGMSGTNIRIATNETWKDKASGAQQERTEWHSIAFFGRLGEIAAEYLRKGSQVFVEGKLRTRKWQDKQGNDRYPSRLTWVLYDNLGRRAVPPAPEPTIAAARPHRAGHASRAAKAPATSQTVPTSRPTAVGSDGGGKSFRSCGLNVSIFGAK